MKLSRKSVVLIISVVLLTALAYVALVFTTRHLIQVDGKIIRHYAFANVPVGAILSEYNITVGSKDLVTPGLDEKVPWGQKIQVVRVAESIENKSELVDFVLDWKNRTTKNLRKVEIQHGHRKLKTWSVKRVFHDGKEVASENSSPKITKTNVDRVIILNSRDFPLTTYDLTKCKKMTLTATAYWVGDPQVPGVITFSGHHVERGLVAVDPKVVPLGWRLFIPGYGYAYSSDTGSAIKGKRIDLFVESKKASLKWEYNKVTVYLLEKSKTW